MQPIAPPCAGPDVGVDAFDVQANPNSVMSAIVTARTHGAARIQVAFASDGGPADTTPTWATPDDGGDQTVPVLGLAPATTYAVQLVATATDGGRALSDPVAFTTGAKPTAVGSFTVTTFPDAGSFGDGFLMIAKLYTGLTGPTHAAEIVDRTGAVRWYVVTAQPPSGDMEKAPDGSYVVVDATTKAFSPLYPGVPVRYDVLGNVLETYAVPDPIGATDQHDVRVLPDGSVLLIGAERRFMDLSQAFDGGSPDAGVGMNQLWALAPDGGATFEWNAYDHLALEDDDSSISMAASTVDATHVNAFGPTPSGNYIVSVRHMNTVLELSTTTGEILWRLGGVRSDGTPQRSDFTLVNDPWNGFSFQHDAQELPNGHILLFDNGNGHVPARSRAVEYALDFDAMTATLVWQYVPTPAVFADAMGSVQRLPDGHTLITYGTRSRIDEVDAAGNLVWQLTDPAPAFGFYRAWLIDTLY